MNYALQLVVGDGADFFLEDWKPGGVGITEEVVGLFDAETSLSDARAFQDRLGDYGLRQVQFTFMDLMRIGLLTVWEWQGARWVESQKSRAGQAASERLAQLLAGENRRGAQTQKRVLQLMQAAVRELGTPTLLYGEISRSSGRSDRVLVYRHGMVAYDHTPHPQAFLEHVARVATP